MSDEFSSSNPFRRKTAGVAAAPIDDIPPKAAIAPNLINTNDQKKTHKKPAKKVRLQSPHSSPEIQISQAIPALPQPDYGLSEFGRGTLNFDEKLERDAVPDIPEPMLAPGVPKNPFSKTLATLEGTESYSTDAAGPEQSSAGKPGLDVDAFKRLLMTGNSGLDNSQTPSSIFTQARNSPKPEDNNARTSSSSKASESEPARDHPAERSYTSYDSSESEESNVRNENNPARTEKKPPPPPNSRHGKLIKAEVNNDDSIADAESRFPDLGFDGAMSTVFRRSSQDSNKSFSSASARRKSHDSDNVSILEEKDAEGGPPELPATTSNPAKKPAPPPPVSRRHSQLLSDTKASRQPSKRLSVSLEDSDQGQGSTPTPPPPPPPSRRPQSNRNSSYPATPSPSLPQNETESAFSDRSAHAPTPPPAPPPARNASVRKPNRPPSVSSMDAPSRRLTVAPPPPPRPRQRASSRASEDTSVRSPAPESSRTSIDSARGSTVVPPTADSDSLPIPNAGANDILADLTTLQKEVDALRGQFEKST